jgi:BirA family biotin operon repressor/biotin-[acetyl-CoA-carboxylase] ligase
MPLVTTEIRLGEVESTMDSARAVAAGQDFLLVVAEAQTGGKGTRGRAWQSPPGNVYMTLGIHRRHLPAERLALLPLEIGVLLWEEAAARLPGAGRAALRLKWPNDLLLGGGKVAGILMEGHGEFVLCGAGVNVAVAPAIGDGGAPSACLAQRGMAAGEGRALAEGFYRRVVEACTRGFDPEELLLAWQAKVDWGRSHRLRDREGAPTAQPLSVNRQGHLLVRLADGSTEWLVSEYLA